ncbi:MAG: TrmH family RNA methyltransferase [Huintestinicola sp.]
MAEIIEVTDLSAKELEVYTKLTEAQLRNRLEPSKGIFIAESQKVIDVAIRSGCKPVSLLTDKRYIDGQARDTIIQCGDIPVYAAESSVLEKLTGFHLTRGVLCAMRRPVLRDAEELCKDAKRIAVLENIVDATNIGAIFRSAAALGMDAVLVTPTCCDPLNRRAVRVSMGTVFQIPWTYIGSDHTEWPSPGLDRIKQMGFRTAAMALSDNSVSIDDPKLASEDKLAVILGAEGDGLSPKTIADCDYVVRIPMSHGVDSLNVAAASAVAFWQLRQAEAG